MTATAPESEELARLRRDYVTLRRTLISMVSMYKPDAKPMVDRLLFVRQRIRILERRLTRKVEGN